MSALRTFVRRHQLLSFVVLAYLCSWWLVLLIGMPLAMGPMFAAMLIVGLTVGRAGLGAWTRQVFRPSAAPGWYVLAAALPILITFAAAGINILMGAAPPTQINWLEPFLYLPFAIVFGGMLEEPGWTGFALPRLLDRWRDAPFGVLIATLVMAAIRISWHLPLMLGGNVPWSDIALMIAVQVIFVWLYIRGGGSALAIMLVHWMNNTFSGEFVSQFFSGADSVRHSWLLVALWGALALGVLLFAGPRLGMRGPEAAAPASERVQLA